MFFKYKLYWYRDSNLTYNFGDEIAPWLFYQMFNINQEQPCDINIENNVLLSVGSVMRLCNSNTEVWGSGIRSIDQSDFKPARKYHAVRGLFSRNQLLNLNIDCPAVYGDPALFCSELYYLYFEKKYDLGIIPHYTETDDVIKKYKKIKNIAIIDLRTKNITNIINQILKCKRTVSSSLHGLIVSISYGIPTRWMIYSNKIKGDNIKYYDFFSSLDANVFETFDRKNKISLIPKYTPIFYRPNLSIKTIIDSTIKYDTSKINLDLLFQSCPIKNLSSPLDKADKDGMLW